MMENEEEQKVTKRCKYQFQPQIADESCDDCKVAANCEVKPNTKYRKYTEMNPTVTLNSPSICRKKRATRRKSRWSRIYLSVTVIMSLEF